MAQIRWLAYAWRCLKLRYYYSMRKPPDNPEFARFTAAMRHIMGVSKSTLVAREDAARGNGKRLGRKKPGPKPKSEQ
jgi:hypothetical protein